MEENGITYSVIRSNRRTIAIQIGTDGKVYVRCPRRMPEEAIHAFVARKSQWIEKHVAKQTAALHLPAFSDAEMQCFVKQAKEIIPVRVAYFARLVGVSYGRITIRCQRTRWGSCSSKGSLNFNCLLMCTPPEVLDYVVVHELCHRREMNHSKRFWAEVARILPDYQTRQKWLKENGTALIARIREESQGGRPRLI